MSIYDNIAFGVRVCLRSCLVPIWTSACSAGADQSFPFMERTSDKFAVTRAGTLSGGQQQRLQHCAVSPFARKALLHGAMLSSGTRFLTGRTAA